MADDHLCGAIDTTWRVAMSAEYFRIEEMCSQAARAQSETVKIWRVLNIWLGSTSVLAAVMAGGLVLAGDRFPILAGCLALAAAMLTTVISMAGPARKEYQAAEAAKEYAAVQTATRQARCVDLPEHAFTQARQALNDLTARWHAAGRSAAQAPWWAQRRAERGTYTERPDDPMTERMSDVVRVFQVAPTADQLS